MDEFNHLFPEMDESDLQEEDPKSSIQIAKIWKILKSLKQIDASSLDCISYNSGNEDLCQEVWQQMSISISLSIASFFFLISVIKIIKHVFRKEIEKYLKNPHVSNDICLENNISQSPIKSQSPTKPTYIQ